MMFSKAKTTATLMPVMIAGATLLPAAGIAQAQPFDAPQVEVEVEIVEPGFNRVQVLEPVVTPTVIPTAAHPVVEEVWTEEVWVEEEIHHDEVYSGVFSCVEHYLPTTMFFTPEKSLPVIHWNSHYFSNSGWDPLTRCRAVSGRFQNFYETGVLNYLTTGIVNRLPVVCVSSELGGGCTGVLLTLKPGANASATLQQLFDLSYGYEVGALYESDSRLYIDVDQYLSALDQRQN